MTIHLPGMPCFAQSCPCFAAPAGVVAVRSPKTPEKFAAALKPQTVVPLLKLYPIGDWRSTSVLRRSA